PWFFLGLGCLTKGPGLLLFFYCVVLAVAWRTGRLRELLQPAHWAGLVFMLLIFSSWAVPFFFKVNFSSLGQSWSHEFLAILFGEKGRSENWALNFPRAIAYFLPCVLLLPFVRFHKIDDSSERETARGLLLGSVVPFVVVLLLPGSVPRYVLPLAAPLSWLVGLTSASRAFDERIGNFHFPRTLARSAVAVVVVAEVLVFSVRAASEARTHHVLKPAAAQINAAISDHEPVYAIGFRYEPYLFYLHAPVCYLSSLDELSRAARFFLIPSKDLLKLQSSARWSSLQPQLLARTNLFRSNDTMLFEVTNPNQ